MPKYKKKISGTLKISEWRSIGIPNKIINNPADGLTPTVGSLGRNVH